MEFAIQSEHFQEDELIIINYCRQYLHVTTVSELFDASGRKLLPHIIKCRQPPWTDPTQFYILQHRPSSYQIRHKWRRLLSLFSNKYHTPKPPFIQFGPWHHDGIRLRSKRESYMILHPRPAIFHWHDNSYWESQPLTVNDQSLYCLHKATTWKPANDAYPIQVQRILNKDGSSTYSTTT